MPPRKSATAGNVVTLAVNEHHTVRKLFQFPPKCIMSQWRDRHSTHVHVLLNFLKLRWLGCGTIKMS